MPTTILYLSQLGGLGGGETLLLSHILALDPTQFAPRVICGTAGALVDELRAHAIPVDVISFRAPYYVGKVLPAVSLGFLPRLYGYLRMHPVALIHCNDIDGVYYAGLVSRVLKLPLVFTCHGWWVMKRGWEGKFTAKCCTWVVTPTEYIKQAVIERHVELANRLSVVPFGVDTDEFAPQPRDPSVRAEFSVPADAPLVTLLARFQAVKGHTFFLDAIPQILDACPNARFLFVGDATFETPDAITTRAEIHKRVADDPRLRAAIVFAGFRRDIARILNATDVLVSPSEFETYGMAILEALACGVPVVSTNVGGPSETMVEGQTGFLVTPRDPQALAVRVIQLLSDGNLRVKFGERARERVLGKFSLARSAVALQALYQTLLK
jgi:glycosyltransferase involved in cell wall biosynthesis